MYPEDLTWALKHLRARKGHYDLYRQYYRGNHRLAFTTENWRSEFGLMVKGVADNLCPTVVDTLVDRLEISGFKGTNEATAEEVWKDNRMDLRHGEFHLEAAKQGDSYLLVWPDVENKPAFFLNTPDQMVVRYSGEVQGKITYACKVWIGEDDKAYATLYYEDRIEKYITKNKVQGYSLPDKGDNSVWEQRQVVAGYDEGGENEDAVEVLEEWPLPNPFGRVPIFHFANNASLGEYGRSELSDVIPLQDILNKDLSDRLITQEFHSYPQRWAIGLAPEYDEDGNPKAPKGGPDRLWYTDNENAKMGQFDASNLEGFVKIADSDRAEIARVSRTPVHHLLATGTPPSGEALRTMEAPLMAKVKDRQDSFGAVWEDAMEFAVSFPGGQSDTVDLVCEWIDKTSISDKEKAEEMVLKQTLGVPMQQLWSELGYTPDQIEEMLTMIEENADRAAASVNAGMNTGFEDEVTPTPQVAPTNGQAGRGGIAPDVLANDITGQ